MSLPRLSYFELRGRAEAIRVFLHATAAPFEDHRVVGAEEWKALLPDLPFGVLPIYRTGDARLFESHAILRYLGRLRSPAPKDAREVAEQDATHDALAESQEDLWRFNWVEHYYDHLETYAKQTLRPRLTKLEAWLARPREGSAEWLGAAFGPVDCVAFCFLDEIDAFFPSVLAEFETLADLRERVAALPGVSAYLASAARPPVFGIGRMGPKVDPRSALPSGAHLANPWSEPIELGPVLRSQRRLV